MVVIAIYLILFKGYSVIKFEDEYSEDNDGKIYGACSEPLGYNYGHNGVWGVGNTPIKAIIDAYRNRK